MINSDDQTSNVNSMNVIDIVRTKIEIFDKALYKSFEFLIQSVSCKFMEKVNIATLMSDIIRNYFLSCEVDHAGKLMHKICSAVVKELREIPDRYNDFPQTNFAVEGFVENYFIQDNDCNDLPLNWKSFSSQFSSCFDPVSFPFLRSILTL